VKTRSMCVVEGNVISNLDAVTLLLATCSACSMASVMSVHKPGEDEVCI
jgi:hypothetical protein